MNNKNVYKTLADKYKNIVAYMGKTHPEKQWIYEPQARHWEEMYTAKEAGTPIAWYNFGVAPEIFIAMDLLPQMIENLSAMRASFPEGGFCESVDAAQEQIPDYLCSAHKSALGGLLDGSIPVPQIMVGSSHPCDSGRQGITMISDYFQIPYFAIDVPYWSGESTFQYVAMQIKEMVSFLEEKTGRNLNPDRLAEVMHYSNETQKYATAVSKLRQSVPCPTSGREFGADTAVYTTLVGSWGAMEYFKTRYEITMEMVNKKEGVIPEERLRIVYLTTPTFFNPKLLAWLEDEYGVVIVSHMMDCHIYEPSGDTADIDEMYYNIARKCVLLPMANHYRGPAEVFLGYCLNMARDYKADAAIFLGGTACRTGWALAKLVKDVLRDELNIPLLTLEVDYGDGRITTPEEMKDRYEEFLNVIL